MVDVNTYGASLVLVGSLLLAYRYGQLNPDQLVLYLYRAFIKSLICVEEVMRPELTQNSYQLVYYNGSKKLTSEKLSFERPNECFSHAEFTWSKDGVSGKSLLLPDSALLVKLQSGQNPSIILPLSTFKIISLTGTKPNGDVATLRPPTAHLVGDVLFTELWKTHFGYHEISSFQAVDNDINILNIDNKGLTVSE